jgi:hypothetical protein
MEWGARRILVALVAGIPPYGTVVFEQFMARVRKKNPLVIEPPKDLDD